jgi:uncharacterized membrane protein YidH (DUF202 family)
MTARRIVGLILIVIGIVALLQGGVFWTDRETVIDAGPLEVTTEQREGFRIPTVVGIISLIGGVVLLVAKRRPYLQ